MTIMKATTIGAAVCATLLAVGVVRLAAARMLPAAHPHTVMAIADETPTAAILHAPYTLNFTARVKVEKGSKDLDYAGPNTFNSEGAITVSNNGKQFLYYARFGKWYDVVIYDITSKLTYRYDSAGMNAQIEPRPIDAFTAMNLLPFPGAGYDEYPLFKSDYSQTTASTQTKMALLSSTGPDQGMAYSPASLDIGQWSGLSVVNGCKDVIKPSVRIPQGGASQVWQFAQYSLFGSTPIAHKLEFEKYDSLPSQTQPPYTLALSRKVEYTLTKAAAEALPDKQYDLGYYLNSHNSVYDNSHPYATGVIFNYDPQGGSLQEQWDNAKADPSAIVQGGSTRRIIKLP